MDAATQRAIVAAAILASEGRPVSLSSRSFWRIHTGFDTSEKSDIINRASGITDATSNIDWESPSGTIANLYQSVGYGAGGPADTSEPKAFAKASFSYIDSSGRVKTTFRSIGISFQWDTPMEDVLTQLDDMVSEMEGEYGLGDGLILAESVIIY